MISVKVDSKSAIERIKRASVALDQRKALQAIGVSLMGWVQEGFNTQGHGKWAPRSINTFFKTRKGPLQDTGKLKGSFRVKPSGNQVTIGSADPKAPFHEFGTKPHTISARGGKWLRFKTVEGPVRTKEVNHPGNPARPMLPDTATAERLALTVMNRQVALANKA